MTADAELSPNKRVVTEYLDGFRTMDHARILACLTDDIRWTVYGAFQLEGKDAYDAAIDGDGFSGRPTLKVVRMVEEDEVVMAELTGSVMRDTGELMQMSMAEAFVMRDGRIAERRAWVIALQENDFK